MESGNQSAALVPAICSQCGAKVSVDPTKEAAVCEYCGTPFIVEKAINKYSTYNQAIHIVDNSTLNVRYGKKGVVESAFDHLDNKYGQKYDYKLTSMMIKEEAARRKMEYKERQKQQSRETWAKIGKVFLWLNFFPVMLTYFVINTNQLSRTAKTVILSVFWAGLLLMFLLNHR